MQGVGASTVSNTPPIAHPSPPPNTRQGFDSDDDDEDEAPRKKVKTTGGGTAGAGAEAGAEPGAGEAEGGAGKGGKEPGAPMVMLPEWIAKAEKKGYSREEYVSKFWKVRCSVCLGLGVKVACACVREEESE